MNLECRYPTSSNGCSNGLGSRKAQYLSRPRRKQHDAHTSAPWWLRTREHNRKQHTLHGNAAPGLSVQAVRGIGVLRQARGEPRAANIGPQETAVGRTNEEASTPPEVDEVCVRPRDAPSHPVATAVLPGPRGRVRAKQPQSEPAAEGALMHTPPMACAWTRFSVGKVAGQQRATCPALLAHNRRMWKCGACTARVCAQCGRARQSCPCAEHAAGGQQDQRGKSNSRANRNRSKSHGQ